MEQIEQNKALNILVPNLIKKTENLTNEINTRLKLNKIFSEFETKASTKLNYFISNSQKRYNCTKYGNNLDKFLLNNLSRNENEANKIVNDKFYYDTNIEKEKEKLKYKSTSKLYKDIKQTFKKMKIPLEKEYTKDSKRRLKILINKIKNNYKKKDIKRKKKINLNIQQNLDIIGNKELIDSEFKSEEKLINNSISKYLNNINNLHILSNFSKGTPWEVLNSTPYKKKPNINLPNIKLINYIHNNPKPIKRNSTKKDIIHKPDIDKLLPYSKIGKNKMKYKMRKELSLNDIESNKKSFLTEANIIIKKNIDFRNTVNLVYNSANKELEIKNYLDKKRRNINELFDINKIPLLNTYDKILLEKTECLKTERYNEAKKLNKKQKSEVFSVKEKAIDGIDNKIKNLENVEKNYFKKININIKNLRGFSYNNDSLP